MMDSYHPKHIITAGTLLLNITRAGGFRDSETVGATPWIIWHEKQERAVAVATYLYPIYVYRCVQHLLSERLRLSA